MLKRFAFIAATVALAGCQTVGGLTVRDYTAGSGERVMAGQAKPKAVYGCQKLLQEKQDWGLGGNMNKSAAMERVTSVAVDSAPKMGANYAYIIAPSSFGVGGVNFNAFSDAEVAYYNCNNLPAAEA